MTNEFWVITTFFNPAKFKSLLNNYFIFSKKLKEQGINLLTVECTFGNDEYQIPLTENVLRLNSKSVLWQKERLVNYGVSQLPKSCKNFAWIDCDVIFTDNWVELATEKLKHNNVLQLFKKVIYLPKGHLTYTGEKITQVQGVVWQKKIHKNWLERRIEKELPFSSPGFAWAMQRDFFEDLGGIYDKNIIGSGDTFLVDCYFDSWDIHGFAKKFTKPMKSHMMEWADKVKKKNVTVDYVPVDIWHLYHGSLKNRRYMDRHDIILQNNYDPLKDIALKDNVYEWNSDKPQMHKEIEQYFYERKEDEVN